MKLHVSLCTLFGIYLSAVCLKTATGQLLCATSLSCNFDNDTCGFTSKTVTGAGFLTWRKDPQFGGISGPSGNFVHLTTTSILTKDGDTTDLVSPLLCYNGTVMLYFDYVLRASTSGTLDILVTTLEGTSKVISLPSTRSWTATNVTLQAAGDSQIIFRGTRDHYGSIAAIDNVHGYSVKPTSELIIYKATSHKPTTPKPYIHKQTTPKPTTHKPTTPKPTTHKPNTHKTITYKPNTHKATTPKPITHKPATPKPTTHKPTTPKPTTHKPTTHKSNTHKTTTPKPTTHKPNTLKTTTHKPTTPKTTTPKPTTHKATTPKPTTHKPTTPKPTTHKPTTYKPTTPKPTTPKPTTPKPTTHKLTTPKPTTPKPTTPKPTTHKPTPTQVPLPTTDIKTPANTTETLLVQQTLHNIYTFKNQNEECTKLNKQGSDSLQSETNIFLNIKQKVQIYSSDLQTKHTNLHTTQTLIKTDQALLLNEQTLMLATSQRLVVDIGDPQIYPSPSALLRQLDFVQGQMSLLQKLQDTLMKNNQEDVLLQQQKILLHGEQGLFQLDTSSLTPEGQLLHQATLLQLQASLLHNDDILTHIDLNMTSCLNQEMITILSLREHLLHYRTTLELQV